MFFESVVIISAGCCLACLCIAIFGLRKARRLRQSYLDVSRKWKAADEELKSTTALLQGLFHASPLPVIGHDQNMRISYWNPAAERLFGWHESEVIGRPSPTWVPGYQPEAEILWNDLKKGRALIGHETSRLKRDGTMVPISLFCAPIFTGGQFIGAVALLEDISERKRRDNDKAKLIESQCALNQMFEATAYASVAISDQALSHNQDFHKVLRTIAEQARLITHADFAAVGVGTSPNVPFDPWVSTGSDAAETLEAPRAQGVLGWVARHGQSVRLTDIKTSPALQGMPIRSLNMEAFLGVPIRYDGRSVGNLYLAKAAGSPPFSQEDQRAIELLAAHCGIVIQNSRLYDTISRDRRRLTLLSDCSSSMVNSLNMTEILKQTASKITESFALICAIDLVGKDGIVRQTISTRNANLFDFPIRTDLQPWMDHPAATALRNHETVTFGIERRRIDEWFFGAHEKDLGVFRQGLIVPLRQQGRLMGLMTLAFDAVLDPEDQRVAEELARRIALSVENSRLYQESQKALKLREDTVAIVSHDLKNPLSAIALAAELLRRTLRKAEDASPTDFKNLVEKRFANPLQTILRAADQGQRLIHNLLDVAQIESHGLALQLQNVQLDGLLHDITSLLAPIARQNSIDLAVVNQSTGSVVHCDVVRVQQVLSNLIGNAIKFSNPGGRVVLEVSEGSDEILFAIRDNGRGIPSDKLVVIFERYYQGTDRRRQGAGLGLFIAKGIVEAHRGRIWAESPHTNGGASFFFTLPRSNEFQETASPAQGLFLARRRIDRDADGLHRSPSRL